MPQFDEEKQVKRLEEIRHREEEALVQQMAQKRNQTYIDLTGIGIDTDALKIIDEKTARKHEVAGFKIVGDKLHLAARAPDRVNVKELVQKLEKDGYKITLYMVSSISLEKAWVRYEDIAMTSSTRGSFLDISESSLEELSEKIKTDDDVKEVFQKAEEDITPHRISRIVEIMFGAAIGLGASDIHIEPQDENVRLRYRTDGVLHDVLFFDKETYRMVNSRIKLLSELMLTQTENAQDGRFTIDFQGKEIEVRTSVIPGGYGESIVMRILNPDNINVGLEDLGIEPRLLKVLKAEIQKPTGMILTTGPTGSGKTTTLYSFLKFVYTPEIKILTIEDPIEYHVEGITQTQVEHEKGYDFLSGLRAAMRQDPDVVMVGEIRDSETANIAVNASLTGHLVLSTLHTNNAAGAIPRLLDLKVNPGILAAALSVSIAQRLVRKLCPHCKREAQTDAQQSQLLKQVLQQAADTEKDLAAYNISPDQDVKIWEPVGCDKCGQQGYKGRIGVFEAILNDQNIQQILEKHPSEREIKIASAKQGILTMKEDGVLKILAGITSVAEVQKVVDLEEDLDLFDDTSAKSGEQKVVSKTEKKEVITEGGTAHIPELTSQSSTKGTEIQLLVDYLKMLEREQVRNPELGVSKQMQAVQQIILDLLKNNELSELFSNNNEHERVQQEVNLLMDDLKKLEHNQAVNPDIGVADKLQKIRTTIESL